MPTMEFDGKQTELDSKKADYSSINYVPKPEEPSIKQPPPKVADTSSTATKTTRTRKTDRADKARTKTEPVPATPEQTAARAQRVSEVLTIASGTLLLAGRTYGNKALRADGHTVAAVTPTFSEAVANVAAVDPAVASLLDNEGSAKAAAYVGLISVSFTIGAQLAANHGLIKPGVMNTSSSDDIIAAFEPVEETPDDDNQTR